MNVLKKAVELEINVQRMTQPNGQGYSLLPPKKANYFVCVHLCSQHSTQLSSSDDTEEKSQKHVIQQGPIEDILDGFSKVQNHVIQQGREKEKKDYSATKIPIGMTNISLTKLRIENEEELDLAKCVLGNDIYENYLKTFETPSIDLNIKGLTHTIDKKVYAKVVPGKEYNKLEKIANFVRQSFKNSMVKPFDEKDKFLPEIKLLELTPTLKKTSGLSSIPFDLYKKYRDYEFGKLKMVSIQLCKMNKVKDTKLDEIFRVSIGGEMQITPPIPKVSHSSHCCELCADHLVNIKDTLESLVQELAELKETKQHNKKGKTEEK